MIEVQAHIEEEAGRVYLVIWHDKGKSTYARVDGAWIPVDHDSHGAMNDLVKDLFRSR
jgi:hypothetical protein